MRSQTGKAVLKVDDFGVKYWEVCNSLEESSRLDNGKPIKFLPGAFSEGTEIRIIEDIPG